MKTIISSTVIVVLLGIAGLWLYASPQAVRPSAQSPVSSSSAQAPGSSNTISPSATTHAIDAFATDLGGAASLVTGGVNKVLVVAVISDPTVITQSVYLFRQSTSTPVLMGSMHDDGLNGDLAAGDGHYTMAVDGALFPSVGTYTLFATAAFRGTIRRAQSQTSVMVNVIPPLTTVDASWTKYSDQNFTITVPTIWVASSTAPGTTRQPDDPLRQVSFALPNDLAHPILYILVYPHGFNTFGNYDEPPNYLDTDNTFDFYFVKRSAETDSSVVATLGLTDTLLQNDLLQAIATFKGL